MYSKKRLILSLGIVCILCIFLVFLITTNKNNKIGTKHVITGKTMGTTYSVSFIDESSSVTEDDIHALQEKIDSALVGINSLMSVYEPRSTIMGLNEYRGKDWFEVPEDLFQLINEAVGISEKTGGRYDITVGDLVNLWKFGPGTKPFKNPGSIPSDEDIKKVLEYTGYKKIQLKQEGTKFYIKKLHPKVFLDLSSIAKGYGVDEISTVLEHEGYENHLVEIGGELVVRGVNSDGSFFRVGVQQPSNIDTLPMKVVLLKDKAIATSGSYKNYYTVGQKQYSHMINPITGRSEKSPVLSTSVIASNCQTADAWATALYFLPFEEGMKLANELHLGIYYIYIDEHGDMAEKWNEEFSKYLEKKQ